MSATPEITTSSSKPLLQPDVALLLLRLAVGGLMLFHGIDKLRHGVGGEREMLSEAGLPELLVYGAYLGEVVAPVLVILGLLTRPAGLLIAVTMLMAIYLADGVEGFALNEYGGVNAELALLYLTGGLALALAGGGRLGVTRGQGTWD